jgi:hypothetical protein
MGEDLFGPSVIFCFYVPDKLEGNGTGTLPQEFFFQSVPLNRKCFVLHNSICGQYLATFVNPLVAIFARLYEIPGVR